MRTVDGRTDRVVVVGAGLGGLACALHLAGSGRQVTVLEREPVPGGRAGRLSVDGYEFDTGPTVLTMPDLIAEALGAVGEELTDWLDLIPLDPAYRAYYPDGSTLDVLTDTDPDGGGDLPGLRATRGRRLPAVRGLRPRAVAAGAGRLHRAQPRRTHRPAHRQPAQAGGQRGLPTPPNQDRPILPGPAYPTDLLLPGHVRRPRAARRAGHLRGDRVPRLGGRRLLPARRHPRGLPGPGRRRREARRADPVRHHGDPGGDRERPGHRRADRRRRVRPGGRGGAQPRPAGGLPRPASAVPPAPADLLAVLRRPARRLDARGTVGSPTTTSTSGGRGRARSTR